MALFIADDPPGARPPGPETRAATDYRCGIVTSDLRRLVVLATIGLVALVGCTSESTLDLADDPETTEGSVAAETEAGGDEPGDASEGPGDAATTRSEIVEAADLDGAAAEAMAALDGSLAMTQGLGLAVTGPDGSDPAVLLDADTAVATQPAWSDDGSSLVWLRSTNETNTVMVSELADLDGDAVEIEVPGEPVFYFQWSPDGQLVAFLRNAVNGAGIELSVIAAAEGGVTGVGVSQPFFIHWAPTDEPTLGAHIGSAQVVLIEGALLAGDTTQPEVLLEPTATFSVPFWIDDSTLLVAAEAGIVALDAASGDTTPIVAASSATPGRFQMVLSPDGTRLAYQAVGLPASEIDEAALALDSNDSDSETGDADSGAGADETGDADSGAGEDEADADGGADETGDADAGAGADEGADTERPEAVEAESGLVVVDLVTWETEVVSAETALSWEWSADGERLAWLVPVQSATRRAAQWRFWSADGTDLEPTPAYEPSASVLSAYLPFFEQYSASITGWSPDGSAFAFAGRIDDETLGAGSSIWVQLLGPDPTTVRVADGDMVTWGSSSR